MYLRQLISFRVIKAVFRCSCFALPCVIDVCVYCCIRTSQRRRVRVRGRRRWWKVLPGRRRCVLLTALPVEGVRLRVRWTWIRREGNCPSEFYMYILGVVVLDLFIQYVHVYTLCLPVCHTLCYAFIICLHVYNVHVSLMSASHSTILPCVNSPT